MYCTTCRTPYKYKCKHCHNFYKGIRTAAQHTPCIKDRQLLDCPHCEQRLTRKPDLNEHIRLFHSGKPRELHPCGSCGAKLKSRGSLLSHQRQSCSISRTQARRHCQYCAFSASYAQSIKRHMLEKHGLEINSRKKYACDKCGRSYEFINNYRKHFNSVCEKVPVFRCDHCLHMTRNKGTLAAHFKNAHPQIL